MSFRLDTPSSCPNISRMSESAPESMGFAKSAAILGGLLLVLYALVVLSATNNAAERKTLETAGQPSAVEDQQFFKLPEDVQPGMELTAFQGRKLVADLAEDLKLDDSAMRLAGRTDDSAYAIYRCLEPGQQGFLFLKIKTDKYQRLR